MCAATITQFVCCPLCGMTNRVPSHWQSQTRQPVCSRCKSPLLNFNHPLTITDANYVQAVERSPLPSFSAEERNYSERTAELIDEETRQIVDKTYERVKTILTNRREELERIAQELIHQETLDRGALEQLLALSPQFQAAVV